VVTRAIEAVRRCRPDNAPQVVAALLKALHAAAGVEQTTAAPEPAPSPTFQPVHGVEAVGAEHAIIADVDEPAPLLSVGEQDVDHIAVVESRFGFNARLGSAVAATAIIGVLALFSFRHQSATPIVGTSAVASDTHSQAAGDIAFGRSRADSSAKRSAPAAAPERPMPEHSNSGMNSRVCRSPAAADQHKCLMDAIGRTDADLNQIYQKLIDALRRQSSATAGDPDPASVIRLRESQRKWVDDRDVACRQVGSGRLYARERSSCFAQQSANRARELQRLLDGLPRRR
jgi:uncharacterized protein YecT (DUF1311 family)